MNKVTSLRKHYKVNDFSVKLGILKIKKMIISFSTNRRHFGF